ncbi:PREDICTED: cadherin EGF LAG seven-pass G-type receptor 2-like isoform X2 [Amphimedon queenslandica]|uniref:Staphylococcus aureus surface protein A n=1 Tax=Amphimedon queenslandica TaxID=400682 RepID=A0AAN0IYW9_AMPQE|nr:PREDICTED: cadherin EGF LAG seven-pass G-type receptor 2-like isoform X2 [Amphimedon queenslandica]|eukprot:XP_019849970.1 PREDICTED: cadherin EGF LAG seven-pass G-type receptor 2-like isoform X2 [Amphimedon queenslandica]
MIGGPLRALVTLVILISTIKTSGFCTPVPLASLLTFSSNVYHLSVSEATPIGQEILQLSVVDNTSHVLYEILSTQSSDDDFYLSPNGFLYTARMLNKSQTPLYNLAVSARNTQPLSTPSYTFVTVVITNDSVFSESEILVPLHGNESVGQNLYTVEATRADSYPFQYTIIGGSNAFQFFTLNSMSGQLSLSSTVNYFGFLDQYRIVVEGRSLSDPLVFGNVVIIFSLSPKNSSTGGFTKEEYLFTVSNETAIGEVFGYVYLSVCNISSDSMNSSPLAVNYSITNSDDVQINPVTGGLSFVSLPRNGSITNLTVIAVTRSGSSFSASVTVELEPTRYVMEIEKRSYMYVVYIDDGPTDGRSTVLTRIDGGGCNNYTILAGDCYGLFSIDPVSGNLTIHPSPLSPSAYSLVVGVYCGKFLSYISVEVRVLDVNNPPVFDQRIYKVTARSSTPRNTRLLTLTYSDLDDPGSSNGTTHLSSTSLPSFLRLLPNGELLLINALPSIAKPWETSSYNFSVVVSDGGSPSLSSTAEVVVIVINDIMPQSISFSRSFYSGNITENSPPGTPILSLSLKNPQVPRHLEITYKLIGSPDVLAYLTISPLGLLVSSLPIDRERYPSLTARVVAEYNKSIHTEATVSITVLDQPDTTPVFLQEYYTVSVQAPLPVSKGLLVLNAITQDSSPITYSLVGSSDIFTLNSATGSLDTLTELSAPNSYTLLAKATSSSGLYNTARVHVRVFVGPSRPQLRPSSLFLSTFSYLLPSVSLLGDLGTFVNGQRRNGFGLSLNPSSCSADKYFRITEGSLYVLNTITSGSHQLNISVTDGRVIWSETITVYANLLTNDSLDHTLSLALPNLSLDHFLGRFLSPFRSALSHMLSCMHECLHIISVDELPGARGVKVVIAAKEKDLVTYKSSLELRRTIEAEIGHISSALSWTVAVMLDSCSSSPCPNPLRQCSPYVSLALPHKTITSQSLLVKSLSSASAHKCVCPRGYDSKCTSELNECEPSPCDYDAVCTDLINDYHCSCPPFTFGKNCSTPCRFSAPCSACSPNPCLNGGSCSIQSEGTISCTSCPAGYTGPLCELTVARVSGAGGASLEPLGRQREVEFSFDFIGVQPNAMLLHAGQLNNGEDYIAIGLVLGNLQVSVRWGNWSVRTTLSSKNGSLNDGQWHSVEFRLNDMTLDIVLGNCIESEVILERDIVNCSVSIPVQTSSKIINLDSSLYLFNSLGESTNQIPSLAQFTGCLSNVKIGGERNGKLVDFSSVPTHPGASLLPGCPQSSSSCQSSCGGDGKCIEFWNGSRCHSDSNDATEAISFDGSSSSSYVVSSISAGTSMSYSSPFNVMNISFDMRTLQDGYTHVLAIGDKGDLELFYGSLIFNYRPSSPMLRPLSLTADARVNDGYWHGIKLSFSSSLTRLSIDDERIVADSNQTITIATSRVELGGREGSHSRSYDGCIRNLRINSETVDDDNYNVTLIGTVTGCSNKSPCDSSSSSYTGCPANSYCIEGWRASSCMCDSSRSYFHNGGTCVQPCNQPVNCLHGGTCNFNFYEDDGFTCVCAAPYVGLDCQINLGSSCRIGFFRAPEECVPCACDREGTTFDICNRDGVCQCNPDIATYGSDCKPCNCNRTGSNSTECDDNGKCPCKPGVTGDHCDSCQTGFVGFGPEGCREGVLVSGSFVIDNLYYANGDDTSNQFIKEEILRELESFVLPTTLELNLSLSNNYNVTAVMYNLVSDSKAGLISTHFLGSVMQTVMGRDCIGRYEIRKNSHDFNADCSLCDPMADCTNSSICEDCPSGSYLDDPIICRSSLPQGCSGLDTDQDGFPDACDSCPYWFNPRQDYTLPCSETSTESCPREKAGDVLWSQTDKGRVDSRECPTPLIGIATRQCSSDGMWLEPNFNNCMTFTGVQLNSILQDLTGEPPSDQNETIAVSIKLESVLSSSPRLYCRDLDSAVFILAKILNLDTLLPLTSSGLKPLAEVLGLLGSSKLAEVWEETGCNAGIILNLTEHLGVLSASSLSIGESLTVEGDGLSMSVSAYNGRVYSGYEFNVNGSTATGVSVPNGVIPLADNDNFSISLTHYSDLSLSLPYTDLSPDAIVGSPVWSIQLLMNGGRVTQLATPINITFPHPIELNSSLTSLCVTWNATRNKWVESGCQATVNNPNSTSCSCPHLSDFTVLIVPYEETPTPPTLQQNLDYLYYISNSVTIIFIVLLMAILFCVYCWCRSTVNEKSYFSIASLQLLFVVASLYIVLYLIELTQSSVLCIVIGLVLECLVLIIACLFVMSLLIVLLSSSDRFKLSHFVSLNLLAFVIPLMYVALQTVILYLTHSSLSDAFTYPDICWIRPSLYYYLLAPLLLVALVFVCLVLYTILHLIRASKDQSHIQNRVNATLFLVFLFIFIVINLSFTMLTLHSIQWSPPFSTVFSLIVILSVVTSAVLIFTVLCCTKRPKIFKLNIESGSSEAAKEFQQYSNNSSCIEDENTQPIYHTIGNRTEELYQEPVPVPPINQLNPGFQASSIPEYHELEQQGDGSNSDSDSENEIDVDVEALQQQTREEREIRERRESNRRISARLEEEKRRRSAGDENISSITDPQQQEAWFNTLDPSSLCAPAAPVTYANGTQLHADSPISTDAHELADLHNEIDNLYQMKSAVLKETVLTADTSSGDYVDLKDDTPAVNNNWYEDGSSSSNHRPRDVTDNMYANATNTSPFDDAQYCTVSEARQYTPDVPRRFSLQNQAQQYSSIDQLPPQPPPMQQFADHTYQAIRGQNSPNASPRRTSLNLQGRRQSNDGRPVARRLSNQTRNPGVSASVQLMNGGSLAPRVCNGSQTLV